MAYTMGEIPVQASRFSAPPGETFSRGQMVALHTDGKLYKANAATGAGQQMPGVGLAEKAATSAMVSAGTKIVVIRQCDYCAGATGLAIGQTIYVGETDGEITTTAPTTGSDIVQPCGHSLSATEFVLDMGANGHTTV